MRTITTKTPRRPLPAALLALAACGLSVSAGAQSDDAAHAHHHHHPEAAAVAADAPTEVPPLRILLPADGAVVGSQLAVIFETPGDLARLTMGAPVVGTHLHIETDEVSLMPTRQQLVALGDQTYLFLFDLPVKPGRHQIRVYWSDATHRTLNETIRKVDVDVRP